MTDSVDPADRRLGDRILAALELAADQQELEIAELLWNALELTLSRYGGAGALEKREPPFALDAVLDKLIDLRRTKAT
ncbi:hypothetical protein [Niveispirillum fermenti]|uniref:hypothetical protein n=1 Tax=Niveispirillum fermenti TaxID=1233113 RepID=UPI003A882451